MIFNHIELSFHPVFPLKFSKLNILKHQKQEILIRYYLFFSIQLFLFVSRFEVYPYILH